MLPFTIFETSHIGDFLLSINKSGELVEETINGTK